MSRAQTHALRVVGLLRQQETRQNSSSRLLINIFLELEHRLSLVLRQPDRLEVALTKFQRQMMKPASAPTTSYNNQYYQDCV